MRHRMMSPMALLFVLFTMMACGPTARQRTLDGLLVTTNAARDGFIAYDDEEQDRILEEAFAAKLSEVEVKAKIATYYDWRRPVEAAFVAAYRAIAVAYAAAKDDKPSLQKAIEYGLALKSAYDEFKASTGATKAPDSEREGSK